MTDVPRVLADGRVLSERSAGFPLPKRGLMSTLGSGAQGAAAGLLGMPVDMMSMLTNPILRMIGQNPGTPVGGTESIGSLLGADVQSLPFTVGSMLPFSPSDAMMGAAPFVARAAGKLDMSTPARMERAREMGFDVENIYYRGAQRANERIDPAAGGEIGRGIYVTRDPEQASEYARPQFGGPYPSGANVEAFHVRGGLKPIDRKEWVSRRGQIMDDLREANDGKWDSGFVREAEERLAKEARQEGFSGYYLKNPTGEPSFMYDQGVVTDPSALRSTNAAFDPAQSNSSNLLAGVAGAGIGTAMLAPQGAEAQQQPPADMETLLRILRELGIQ